MGYAITQLSARFCMKLSDENIAYLEIIDFLKSINYIGYRRTKDITTIKSFRSLIQACGFLLDVDKNGDYVSLWYTGLSQRNVLGLLNVLAPYVKEDSYLKFIDDEEIIFGWFFHNGKCIEIIPKIDWSYPAGNNF